MRKKLVNKDNSHNPYKVIISNYLSEAFWHAVLKQSNILCLQVGLFLYSPEIHIEFVNFVKPKPRAYNANHHRATSNPMEVFGIFIMASLFKNYRVIADYSFTGFLRFLVLYVGRYIFEARSIYGLSSEDRYWLFANPGINEDLTASFPDRESSQFFGDTVYYYKDGMFAASLYNQLPIYETVIIEPRPAKNYTSIYIYEVSPPSMPPEKCTNAKEFAQWRAKHAAKINEYTRDCERRYKTFVASIEEKIASCFSHEENGICLIEKDNRERDLRRNKSYPEYYFKQTGFKIK